VLWGLFQNLKNVWVPLVFDMFFNGLLAQCDTAVALQQDYWSVSGFVGNGRLFDLTFIFDPGVFGVFSQA